MSFSDETLRAYADGVLDEATRRAVEEAMRSDDGLARRVAQLRTQGDRYGAYGRQAEDAAPRRQTLRGATVVQLAAVRAHRAAHQSATRKAARRRWSWLEWSALAGVLLIGVVAGKFGLAYVQLNWPTELVAPNPVAVRDGMLVAQGKLAQALNLQLGGTATNDGNVRIGVSFVAGEGGYCRSFTLASNALVPAQALAGLACRTGDDWLIPVLVQNGRQAPQAPAYRGEGSDTPPAVLEAIDQRIAGPELDVKAEQEAQRKGWQR
jgi:hypothetical protein